MLINKIKLLGYNGYSFRLRVLSCILVQLVAVCLFLKPVELFALHIQQPYVVAFWPMLVKMIVMMALSYGISVMTAKKPPKPQHAKPAGMEQFDMPTAEEGRPMQILFGKKYISGPNVVWYGNLRIDPIIKRM